MWVRDVLLLTKLQNSFVVFFFFTLFKYKYRIQSPYFLVAELTYRWALLVWGYVFMQSLDLSCHSIMPQVGSYLCKLSCCSRIMFIVCEWCILTIQFKDLYRFCYNIWILRIMDAWTTENVCVRLVRGRVCYVSVMPRGWVVTY